MAASAVSFASGGSRVLPARPPASGRYSLLLTSLPLVFGEDFSLQATGSPALQALETRYRVVLISVTDPAELKRGSLLLMAQPFAQPAEDLVALDQWVRRADACFYLQTRSSNGQASARSEINCGPRRCSWIPAFLRHWGLRLDPPDRARPQE